MVTRNVVHENAYFDSVVLMRVAARLNEQAGIENASLMMGTDSNREMLQAAGLLAGEGKEAGPNDLIVAIRGDETCLSAALEVADATLLGPWSDDGVVADVMSPAPRRLADAPDGVNLAMISTPGRYAAAEALKALRRGMNAFIFSDNVPVSQEILLKQEARKRGLLVMGPDCGTAMIDGVPLGFANAVRRGDIGLVGASGTGLQQVSTLLHSLGAGVSQVIGVGSRDLSAEVGAVSMLSAIDSLGSDPATKVIVLISKPPAPDVAQLVMDRAVDTGKPVVVNFLGSSVQTNALSVVVSATLREAARSAALLSLGNEPEARKSLELAVQATDLGPRRLLRALYAGGTFAYEAQLLLEPVVGMLATTSDGFTAGIQPTLPPEHTILDLGDDNFTAGRPHPMIDPSTRVEFLRAAAQDPTTAVIVLDIVIGYGAADDPAGALAPVIAENAATGGGPLVIAFVVGTSEDAQNLGAQEELLRKAGALVVDSSTTAAEAAADVLTRIGENQ